jgi:hypothetical protein
VNINFGNIHSTLANMYLTCPPLYFMVRSSLSCCLPGPIMLCSVVFLFQLWFVLSSSCSNYALSSFPLSAGESGNGFDREDILRVCSEGRTSDPTQNSIKPLTKHVPALARHYKWCQAEGIVYIACHIPTGTTGDWHK